MLVLGGAGGGCLAITGTHSQLLALAERIHTAVRDAPGTGEHITAAGGEYCNHDRPAWRERTVIACERRGPSR